MSSITKRDYGKWLARISFKDANTGKFKTKSGSFKIKVQANDFENLMNYSVNRYSFSSTSPLVIFFICQTGARYEEASGLSWENIDFENLTLSFRKAYKINPREIGPLKNEYSYRTISISPKLANLLQKQKQMQDSYYELHGKVNEYNFVFRNQRLENPSNRTVNNMLSDMLKEIKSKKQVSIHGLRHTHVSYLIAHSYDILFISNRIGHADASTTLRVYSHLMKDFKNKENSSLRNLFNK